MTDIPWTPPPQPPAGATGTRTTNAITAQNEARGYASDAPAVGDVVHTSQSPTTPSQPLTSLTYSWGSCNNCAELPIDLDVQNLWEPGPGTYNHDPNFGPGTHSYDDNTNYYHDKNFYNLCGPGAADAALWWWPAPSNTMNTYATDPYIVTTTYWAGKDVDSVYRLRGYMADLAWNIHAPNWPTWTENGVQVNGMMQGGAATSDSKLRDALNWEASGENTSTWQNYYYDLVSETRSNSSTFYNNVQFDIGTNNVPVVVLLNANAGLPNWYPSGTTGHFVTIVGYNNTTGEYAYVDTCGASTGCNTYDGSKGGVANTDGGVKLVSQSSVWNAIVSYRGGGSGSSPHLRATYPILG